MIKDVEIRTPDGTADAYLAHPDGRHPGVLLLPDAFGLRPQIASMTERLSEAGYTVLAPNLFYRAGRAPLWDMPDLQVPEVRQAFFARLEPVRKQLTPDGVLADLGSYLDFLQENPATAPGPVAIVGYCMGGRYALRAAGVFGERVAAVAAFHAGQLVGDNPDAPIHVVDGIRGEVLLAYADNDASASPEHVETFDNALAAASVRYSSAVYPGAPHGYTMADTAMHHPEGEQRHWRELFALLNRVF